MIFDGIRRKAELTLLAFDVVLGGDLVLAYQVFEHFAPLACDRQLEGDLRKTLELIREKHYAV